MQEHYQRPGHLLYNFLDQIYGVKVPVRDYEFTTNEIYGERFRVIYAYDNEDKTIEIKSIDTHTQVEEFYCPLFLNKIEDECWEDLRLNQ